MQSQIGDTVKPEIHDTTQQQTGHIAGQSGTGEHTSHLCNPVLHKDHGGLSRAKRFSWSSIPTFALAIAGVGLIALSASRMVQFAFNSDNQAESGAARQAIMDSGDRFAEEIERAIKPAIRRGQIVAHSSDLVRALSNEDVDGLNQICNETIRNSTEIDAVAFFNNTGEILAINTIYSDGSRIPQARIDQIVRSDFSERDIIMQCVENDAKSEILEFQTTCDITPALFDSSGLSVAHSVPVFDTNGEQVGLVSTRLRFERLTSLINKREIANGEGAVWFVTDHGGFFDEALNMGAQPPVPSEELASFTDALINHDVNHVSFDRDETAFMIFRMSGLTTMEGGGIQAMIATPHHWLNREARVVALIAVGTPGVLGFMLLLVAGLYRMYLKTREQCALSQLNLLQSRNLAETIERSGDATMITDESGLIKYANESARKLGQQIGYPISIGKRAILFDTNRVDIDVPTRIKETLEIGWRFRSRVELKHDENSIDIENMTSESVSTSSQWVESTAFALPYDDQNEGKYVLSLHDVSADVRHEEQIRIQAMGSEIRYQISSLMGEDDPLIIRMNQALETLFDIQQLGPITACGVYLVDDADTTLGLLTHVSKLQTVPSNERESREIGLCAYSEALRTGEISVGADAQGDGNRYIFPLIDDSFCVGVLFLDSEEDPTEDQALLDVLNQIGSLLASAIVRDWRDQCTKKANEDLTDAQVRYELAITGSRDAIFDWNISDDRVFYSGRWAELLERDYEDLEPMIAMLLEHVASSDIHRVKQDLHDFVQNDDSHLESEFRLMTNEGRVVWALLRAAASRNDDGTAKRVSGSVADISSLKAVEEEMRRLIQQDHLTGLASRSKLLDNLEQAIERSKRTHMHTAVLFFDFDRFKVVNDSLGHDAGDELLCNIARRLEGNLRKVDTAARFGGDEFVILLEDLPNAETAREIADKLLDICAQPHQIRGHQIVSTASIGVVTTEMASCSPESMLRDSDAAMYQAKASGRGCVVEFDMAMLEATKERLALEEEIREAISANQFSLHYQPIVDLESGDPIGAEALARWNHHTRGYIPPDVFISIAEESNQIQELGDLVLREACRQVVDWKNRGVITGDFTISVNLSKVQLTVPGFVDHISEMVSNAGLTPKDLKLEVTETTIVDNRTGIVNVLHELRELGFIIMMDDFGTGHSSLSGLHSLPIDELKIDQSFIRHENASKEIIAITSSIVTLADHLQLRTVGEGIESSDHIALLQNLGCHYGQGYFFSKPLPPEMLESWLSTRGRERAA